MRFLLKKFTTAVFPSTRPIAPALNPSSTPKWSRKRPAWESEGTTGSFSRLKEGEGTVSVFAADNEEGRDGVVEGGIPLNAILVRNEVQWGEERQKGTEG